MVSSDVSHQLEQEMAEILELFRDTRDEPTVQHAAQMVELLDHANMIAARERFEIDDGLEDERVEHPQRVLTRLSIIQKRLNTAELRNFEHT